MPSTRHEVIVIGGGIVGIATADVLSRRWGRRVAVLEAEPRLARHQTGRNSGVIHAGLYYKPGSEKARLCAAGREALYRFCEDHGLPYRRCGKLVVATHESQLPALDELERRAGANGLIGYRRVDGSEIRETEPAAAGIEGLWISETGIVDFVAVTEALAQRVRDRDGEIEVATRVRRIDASPEGVRVETDDRSLEGRLLINCSGLQSDRVARMAGIDPEIRLIPFRGEYYEAQGQAVDLVRGLIYPVPDPRFPFLGVHWTRTVDDRVLAGPNAVPAFHREGYSRSDFSMRDVTDTLAFPGFWRLASHFWRTGLAETRRSLNKRAFLREAQRLIPGVAIDELRPAPSGVRAQAVDRRGRLLDDFFILQRDRMIHVLNAPSPAATASLAIGTHIAALAEDMA